MNNMEVSGELNKQANEYISHYPKDQKRSASLPLLHLLQKEHGYIDEEGGNWVAEKLDIEPINVLELVTFYPGLRQAAPGKYHIRVCRTLSCAMAGCYDTMEKFCEVAGIDRSKVTHHNPIAVSEDGKFSLSLIHI